MKYYVEESLSNFKFWSGAVPTAELLTEEQFDIVELILESSAGEEGWSDTAINDLFWFDGDTIAQWLGFADEEHLEANVTEENVEEAQQWANDMSIDYDELFNVANLQKEDYICTDEDEEPYDWDRATEDFINWWNNMSDIEQVSEFRKYELKRQQYGE